NKILFFFFSRRRRHTRCYRDWSSDVCSSDLVVEQQQYVFDNFWNKATPANQRITEIEEGRTIRYETKVFRNEEEIASKIKESLRSEERRVGKECRSRKETDH